MNDVVDTSSGDELFAAHEQTSPTGKAREITRVSLSELHPFPGHPFRVLRDIDMEMLATSIRANGVLVPLIVRPRRQGGYEIISGHRRTEASRLAGKPDIPVEIRRDMNDNEAVSAMGETNLKNRSKLLPSERAWAYRMMRDALVYQGVQLDDGNGGPRKSKDKIAEHFDESASKVMRIIRLTYLNQPLLDMVDKGKLKLGTAVQISYLDTEVQCWIIDYLGQNEVLPSTAKVKELRSLYEAGKLTQDAFSDVMEQEQPEKPSARKDDFIMSIRDEHFPGLTIDDVKEKLLELIEQYHHRKNMGM